MSGLRARSLDALRGYAIVTMVLSSTIFSNVLPGWMSHVQCPPPNHVFNPDIAGISWVDLVFPFFLFAMGAAMPFSVGGKIERGENKWFLSFKALLRGLKLAFFAIFIQHMYPTQHASLGTMCMWLCPVSAFVALFLIFGRYHVRLKPWVQYTLETTGLILALVLLYFASDFYERTFSLERSNIIILVLANMSFFATVIYIATHKCHVWCRLIVMPFVIAILLHGDNGWQKWLFQATPAPWLYKFVFLKYLCIVLPGTVAGDFLKQNIRSREHATHTVKWHKIVMLLLSLAIIVGNLYGLYTRELTANLIFTIVVIASAAVMAWYKDGNMLWKQLMVMGGIFLILGLFVEPFEGGIKKDPSTVSYYLVTVGLACYALIAFDVTCSSRISGLVMKPLEMAGQNPMLAYVTTALIVNPTIQLMRLHDVLEYMQTDPVLGFLRGVIVTSFTLMIAMLFTRIKWFWRT